MMICQTAPEERPETRIRFAEGGIAGDELLPVPPQAGRQHPVHPVNPV